MKPHLIPFALPVTLLPAVAGAAEQAAPHRNGLSLGLILSIGLPILVGVIVLLRLEAWVAATRRALKRRQDARRRPGSSPLNPLLLRCFDEMAQRAHLDCSCERQPQVVFEGPTPSQQRKLWLVIEMCPSCEVRRQTYYDVTAAQGQRSITAHQATPIPR
jgi:hypothetical protein